MYADLEDWKRMIWIWFPSRNNQKAATIIRDGRFDSMDGWRKNRVENQGTIGVSSHFLSLQNFTMVDFKNLWWKGEISVGFFSLYYELKILDIKESYEFSISSNLDGFLKVIIEYQHNFKDFLKIWIEYLLTFKI